MKHKTKSPFILLFLLLVTAIAVLALSSGARASLVRLFSLSPLAPPPSPTVLRGLQSSPLGTPVPLPQWTATPIPVATAIPTIPPPPGYPTGEPWPPQITPEPPRSTPTRPPSLVPFGSPPDDQQSLYYVADNTGCSELHVIGIDARDGKRSEFIVDEQVLDGLNLVGLYSSPNGTYLALELLGDGYGEVKIVERSSGRIGCPLLKTPRGCWGSFSGWTSDNQFLFQPFDVPPEGVVSLGIIVVDVETGQYRPLDLPVSPDGVYSLARNVSPSPDGSRVAYSITDSKDGELTSEIWIMQVDGTRKQLACRTSGLITALSWSPISEQLIYVYQREPSQFKPSELWLVNADGSDAKLLAADLAGSGESRFRPTWSPDGRYVAFAQLGQPIIFDGTDVILAWSNICVVDTITGQITRLSSFEGRETNYPIWSPDGKFVAFVSAGRSGEALYSEVWIARADGSQLYRISETAKWNNALIWLPPLLSHQGAGR